MKRSITLVLTLLASGLSLTANAGCLEYFNVTHSISYPSDIQVPDSMPVGTLILTQPFSGPYPTLLLDCPTSTPWLITGKFSGPYVYVPGVGVMVQTNVPGIAMRLREERSNGHIFYQDVVTVGGTWPPALFGSYITVMRAEFYKYGPVTSGTIARGSIWDWKLDGGLGRRVLLLNSSYRFVNPTATCDLATGDVNRTIALPAIQASALTNAPSAGAFNFELTANCSNANAVTFRFSGTPAAGDAWRFANTGTAAGTALWLYSRIGGVNQTLRADGSDSSRTVAVSNNRAVLPLGAAYFKTGTVRQGTLASTATVNITYN